ncbi:MAG: DEAD/DEAH box helicase [Nitriliruptoraceae bacterium]
MTTTRDHLQALALRDWQAQALAAWSHAGRGVVEAVTGTGKTRLALAAVRLIVDRGGRALVLVPTLELQQQWVRELRHAFAGHRIGMLGGGHDDDLFSSVVLVSTPHSAAQLPIDLPPGSAGLLVADEAHRYGAPTWANALGPQFVFRLALTATYERTDDGVTEVLAPYFGDVVFSYGFAQARADGTIAPFDIAMAAVELDDAERAVYDAADERCRQLHRELVGGLGMPKDPAGLFAAAAAIVAQADGKHAAGRQVVACREYLYATRRRRDAAAQAAAKLTLVGALAPALTGRRTLVFADTVEQADAVARTLSAQALAAETVHGGLDDRRRRIRVAQFRNGKLDALVAPRVLDEGVDVPDADVAVVLAAFRTRRQLVQRLGRILRLKSDGRHARLVVVYAAATREDPGQGGHRAFLQAVQDSAESVVIWDAAKSLGQLPRWLST